MRRSKYSVFRVLHGRTVYFQMREDRDGTVAAKECSASNVVAYFRAWVSPEGNTVTPGYLVNLGLTKTVAPDGTGSQTAGVTGWFRGVVEFTSAAGQVVCEVVLADTAQARATGATKTPSGYLEELWGDRWTAEVEAAVTPA